jgi:hypothetical protein
MEGDMGFIAPVATVATIALVASSLLFFDFIEVQVLRVFSYFDLPYAEARLASHYFNGWGVGRDYAEARRLATYAADQGSSEGKFWVSWFDDHGIGSPRNPATAIEQWINLAQRRDWHGANKLCEFYAMGSDPDPTNAYFWYLIGIELDASKEDQLRSFCKPNDMRAALGEKGAMAVQTRTKAWLERRIPPGS